MQTREERSLTRNPQPLFLETQMPAIPITPTVSRIFAISLAVSDPFVAHKKLSNARLTSASVVNSLLKKSFRYFDSQIVEETHFKKSYNPCQNSGFDTVWWYVVRVSDCWTGLERRSASRVIKISFSGPPRKLS